MKAILYTMAILCAVVLTATLAPTDFVAEQKKYERVRNAFNEKGELVEQLFTKHGIDPASAEILIVSFKEELELEIHARNKGEQEFKRIKTYTICSSSGRLGPKRRQGDYQVPEGFYIIDRFNPVSNYHLSLGLDYPNASDRKKSKAPKLGGDIFIHGACATIGCMPMTDDKIKEIYIMAVMAKHNGQHKIPVYSFPFRMTEENTKRHERSGISVELVAFWRNLKAGYDKLQRDRDRLVVTVDANGDYGFE
jgi:murein L,D-transpeptidase YafK